MVPIRAMGLEMLNAEMRPYKQQKEVIRKAQANLSTNLTEAEILTVLLPDTNLEQRLNDPEDWVHLLAGLFSYITGL